MQIRSNPTYGFKNITNALSIGGTLKILIADDDRDLAGLLTYAFKQDGFDVVSAYDGQAALERVRVESPNLVILDLNLPKKNGMEVLREMRRQDATPVIVLTAANDEEHTVDALLKGADDYLAKPFHPRELKARVQAVLRRSYSAQHSPARNSQVLHIADLELNPLIHQVTKAGKVIGLTRTEFELLHYLMLNHDIVVSGHSLLEHVWGWNSEANEEVVKVTISRLRRKIEPAVSEPRYIITVPGVGYMFRSESS